MFDMRGRLVDIVRDVFSGSFRITLEVFQIPRGIDALRDTELAISLKKWRNKRSLTANAYYWVLVSKIADAIHAPQGVVHNQLLRDYGQLEMVDGSLLTVMVPESQEAMARVDRAELYHLKPTGHMIEGKDGRQFRAYFVIKGSSEYDTKEMATLIDGAVQEAREMGIETLPEEEVRRMMEAYDENYKKHSAG